MCKKCTTDGREYTHLSDLANMLSEAFMASGGEDLPVILDDDAGDAFWRIKRFVRDGSIYRFYYDYRSHF